MQAALKVARLKGKKFDLTDCFATPGYSIDKKLFIQMYALITLYFILCFLSFFSLFFSLRRFLSHSPFIPFNMSKLMQHISEQQLK